MNIQNNTIRHDVENILVNNKQILFKLVSYFHKKVQLFNQHCGTTYPRSKYKHATTF